MSTSETLTLGRDSIAFTLTSEQTGGDVAVATVTMAPGGGPPMLHRHEPAELYRVRRGEFTFYLEGAGRSVTRRVAGPGATVAIAGGLEHTIRNESDEEAVAVAVYSPGEPMERFVQAASGVGQDRLPGLAEAHGIEMTRTIDDALEASGGYLTIASFDGDGDRLLDEHRTYAEEMSGVGRDHGLILSAAAKTESGFVVVNVWPSQAESQAAARDPRRLAVLEQAEIDPNRIHREHHELAHMEILG